MLKVDVKVGETLKFSGHGDISITMSAKSGQRSRFIINADKTVNITLPKQVTVRSVVSGGLT